MKEISNPIHPRKLEIVDAAVSCFIEQGYHQTGVRDIARKANVSLGNLYNHFKGKEAILVFIAEMEGEELMEFTAILSSSIEGPQLTLRRFITAYTDYTKKPENALLGIEVLSEALRNTAIADIFGQNRQALIDALSSCLSKGQNNGEFAILGDSHDTACLVLDAIEGYGIRSNLDTTLPAQSEKALADFIFRAIRA